MDNVSFANATKLTKQSMSIRAMLACPVMNRRKSAEPTENIESMRDADRYPATINFQPKDLEDIVCNDVGDDGRREQSVGRAVFPRR